MCGNGLIEGLAVATNGIGRLEGKLGVPEGVAVKPVIWSWTAFSCAGGTSPLFKRI